MFEECVVNRMSEPKWKSVKAQEHAEAHWSTVPDYDVVDDGDRKVDEHPHKGVAIYD